MGRVEEKVACMHCGKEFSKAGVSNHEKACPENPENKAPLVEEEEIEMEVEAVEEALVSIKMRDNIDCYIGDRYYRLKAKEMYEVLPNVKEILNSAGLLEAI